MRRTSPEPGPARTPERSGFRTVVSLLPYLWPKGEWRSHARVIAAVIFLIVAKVATVYVPLVYSHAVDALAPKGAAALTAIPVALIGAYVLLRISSAGFAELRDAVFSAVQQRTVRRVGLQTFQHLHRLSLRFHLDRHTGALSRAMDRGSAGVDNVLRLSVFNIVPTMFELLLVTGILWRLFDWRYTALTFVAVSSYVAFTLLFTTFRVRVRRTMNEVDSEARGRAVDSLLNYETVKYFGNERHEASRYNSSLSRYEKAAVRSQVTLNLLNIGQAIIISVGLGLIMLMAARGVQGGGMTVGRFVLVNTYLMQLYQPLNFLGFVYREIKQGLVDMEEMFNLLRQHAEIADPPDATPLAAPTGSIVFEDVRFGYRPDREILHGVSFTVPPGRSLAIVGPTGAGKSTISRLLFRFYDVTGGRILVDGRDVRTVTQDSLRAAMGVVPQDTVLFNDTIGYNIAYGRPDASQTEIEAAARLAQVHDFVMRLPDGYGTMVGERGLKLSGGEKQRVAIARTILKNPAILIFDEATSALDSRTEQDIQQALRLVSRHRTTVTIAHRLSTVVEADEILVLHDGFVAERGSHPDLLARGGLYARMWAMQAEQREKLPEEEVV